MKVTVTQKHIDDGEVCNCTSCPIALALRDEGVQAPIVDARTTSFFRNNGSWCKYYLPPEARSFIHKFDNGIKVEPIEFELSLDT